MKEPTLSQRKEDILWDLEDIYEKYIIRYLVPIFLILISSLVLAVGLYDSPISIIGRENGLGLDPEYLNGVLTASGVLFGFWAILMEKRLRKPEPPDIAGIFEFEAFSRAKSCFFVALGLLVASIIFVCLTALKFFAAQIALIFEVASFVISASLLTFIVNELGGLREYREEQVSRKSWDKKKAK